jgi:peptide/nickel transport system permease protein
MWARCLYGGRQSLPAGFGVVVISFALGAPLGFIAGYARGILDDLIMRAMDLMMAFPGIFTAMGVITILGPGLKSTVIAVGIVGTPGYARVARGAALTLREQDFVLAARALGTGHRRIVFRHILINAIDPLIVIATLNLGGAILVTAALSFLGLGTQLPSADWGSLMTTGYVHMFQAWSEAVFPGAAIVVTVLGINLLGDGLADALNPRLTSRG